MTLKKIVLSYIEWCNRYIYRLVNDHKSDTAKTSECLIPNALHFRFTLSFTACEN